MLCECLRGIRGGRGLGAWLAAVLLILTATTACAQTVGRRQIRAWEGLLRSENPQMRASAATSLLSAEDASALDALLKALKPDQPDAIRVSVMTAFGVSGDDRAMGPLIQALGDGSDAVRAAAAAALATIQTPQAVQKLIETSRDTNAPAMIRRQTIGILSDMREMDAIPQLIELLADADEDIRKAAGGALQRITLRQYASKEEWDAWWQQSKSLTRVELLEQLAALQAERITHLAQQNEKLYLSLLTQRADPKDPAPLIAAFNESDSAKIRLYAIDQLARLQGEAVNATLVAALRNPEPAVRARAAEGLGVQDGPEAPGALTAVLKDPSATVRLAAVKALGTLKVKEAVGPLCEVLGDAAPDVAVAAANALGELADPAALDPLVKAVGDAKTPPALYEAAAQALARIRDPRAAPALVKLLESPKESVRWAAVDALGALQSKDAVTPLSNVALKDANAQIREAALAALGRIGAPEVLDAVLGALADSNKRVSDQAMRALVTLAGSNPAVYGVALDRLIAARSFTQAEQVLNSAVEQLGRAANKEEEIKALRYRLAKGLMAAEEWPKARAQLQTLAGDPKYMPEMAACLRALQDYDALLALLAQARRATPEKAAAWWDESVRAVELMGDGDPAKIVAAVDAMEKETPELGGPTTAARLRELRAEARKKLPAAPAPQPTPAAPAAPTVPAVPATPAAPPAPAPG